MEETSDLIPLAVVLINYDNEEDTIPCLETLADQTLDNFLTIVVDNGSNPESFEAVRDRFDFPVYIRNESNRGFTGGNNVGIEYALDANAEYVLLLNNDTELEPEFLEDLMEVATELPETAGVVGPKIHTYGTNELWAAGGRLDPYTGTTVHRKGSEASFDTTEQVDYVVGAAMLVRSSVFERVGLLDEEFFIYYGETEFCLRAREHGHGVWYVPVGGLYHKETVQYTHSEFREYYFTRNRWLFEQKTQPFHRLFVFYPYFFVRWILLQMLYLTLIERDTSAAKATLRGAFDAVQGKTGERG